MLCKCCSEINVSHHPYYVFAYKRKFKRSKIKRVLRSVNENIISVTEILRQTEFHNSFICTCCGNFTANRIMTYERY